MDELYFKTAAFPVYVSFCCLPIFFFNQKHRPMKMMQNITIQPKYRHQERILIISAGSVISLTLMLIILHEFVTFWQIHAQSGESG